MKTYKGIIFDLDGVICHTDEYHYQAWKRLADQLHIPFDREMNNQLRGVSRMDSLDIILKAGHITNIDRKTKEIYAKMKNEYYVDFIKDMQPQQLSQDVSKTLKYLKEKGYLLAIGSSSQNTKFILDKLGIMNQFDAVCDGTNIQHAKPHPEVFLKAAQMLHLSIDECAIVEDAISGIDAARNGLFDSFGIGDASHYDQATYHIQNLSDLLKYL